MKDEQKQEVYHAILFAVGCIEGLHKIGYTKTKAVKLSKEKYLRSL